MKEIHNSPLRRPRLENWVIFEGRAYGRVVGDLRFCDGEHFMTTPIVEGPTTTESSPPLTTIKTRSGTVYELGFAAETP